MLLFQEPSGLFEEEEKGHSDVKEDASALSAQ